MGSCISCMVKCLDDDEPSTYSYTKPLLPETDYYDEKTNTYVFASEE